MKSLFLFMFSFFQVSIGFTQNIPSKYYGEYKGNLEIFSGGNKHTLEMEFKLRPTQDPESLDYILIYHSPDQKNIREYVLKYKDSLGNYDLDEQNGIVIPTKFVNNSLHSFFEVQNHLLKSSIRFFDNHTEFEIVMANTKTIDTTKATKEDIEVLSYPVGAYLINLLDLLNSNLMVILKFQLVLKVRSGLVLFL